MWIYVEYCFKAFTTCNNCNKKRFAYDIHRCVLYIVTNKVYLR